ncbi:hypothetical protein FB567DRAFT_592725 [Paraphoma chrysanthemicola]|uniref:Uncharacterized protein n=1 Tax=Paraphoma chrysanthemicola TaxID=798071 RepID=A0A8K0R5R3_9PLEO|nr:hypothetical protein FB567DRAFT_592725 [Paraphoma chrysanthemicola]
MSAAKITKKSRHRDGRVTRSATKKLKDAFEHNRNSPLLRLPGEIRNRIYEYAFGGENVYSIAIFSTPEVEGWDSEVFNSNIPNFGDLVSPTMVCRQIYDEARTLPYALSTFIMNHYGCSLVMWIKQLHDWQRNAIQNVAFEFGVPHWDDSDRHTVLNMVFYALRACTGITRITTRLVSLEDQDKIEAFAESMGIRYER